MTESNKTNQQLWPFDQTAPDYDQEFTNSILGRIYRNRVWARMDVVFADKPNILELGCGTGEDALYLVRKGHQVTAIDASEVMVQQTQSKIQRANLDQHLDAHVLNIEKTDMLETFLQSRKEPGKTFDGVLANFGVLNCVPDISAIASSLHKYLSPGASCLFAIMGPIVPWEWLWYLLKGQPKKAFRRFNKNGVSWRGITINYPSIRKVQTACDPYFFTNQVIALGTFLPPSYAEKWAKDHPKLIENLTRMEEQWVSSRLVTHFADHFLLEMTHI